MLYAARCEQMAMKEETNHDRHPMCPLSTTKGPITVRSGSDEVALREGSMYTCNATVYTYSCKDPWHGTVAWILERSIRSDW